MVLVTPVFALLMVGLLLAVGWLIAAHTRRAQNPKPEADTSILERLESLTATLQTARTGFEIAHRVVLETCLLLESPHGCALLTGDDGQSLEQTATTGAFEHAGAGRGPGGHGFSWTGIQERLALLTDDPGGIDNPTPSQLNVPMSDASGAPLGTLVVARDRPYSATDRRVMQVIASLTASALERVRATEAFEAKCRETQTLLSLARLLEGNEPESLGLALEMVRQLTEADAVVFGVLENGVYRPRAVAGEASPSLRRLIARGLDENAPALTEIDLGQGLEITDVPGHSSLGSYGSLGVRSAYLIGVQTEGRIGGLALLRHTRAGGWTEPQRRLIDATTQMLGALVARLDRLTHFEAAYEGALRTIGVALEARDRETAGHTDRVTGLAERIGRELGLSEPELRELRWGAYLHDIGKLAIPDAILFKPGKLDSLERSVIETHATIGYRLALNLPFLPKPSRNVVRYHHERWDGLGYPDKLFGETIPLEARIFAVCDVFDALISERPYKKAMSFEDALEILQQGALSGQFDPRVMTAFEVVVQREWGLYPPPIRLEGDPIPAD
jgi:putative nucleotidyltransferase with HDIG domain